MEMYADTYENFVAAAKHANATVERHANVSYAYHHKQKLAEYDHDTGIVTIP